MKKVRSSQPAILVLNWIKHSFPCEYRYKFHRIQMKAPEICKKETLLQVFSWKFSELFKNNFFYRYLWTTASGHLHSLNNLFFLAMEWTNRNQAFYICKHDLSRLSSVMNIMSSPWWALHLENFTKQTTHRSSLLLMFFRIGVLKNFTNFTVCEMFRITFLYKSPPVAASWPSYCCIGRHIIILIKLVNIYI